MEFVLSYNLGILFPFCQELGNQQYPKIFMYLLAFLKGKFVMCYLLYAFIVTKIYHFCIF